MRERWAAGFTQRAERFWTDERLHNQLGDKHLLLPPVAAAPLLRALNLLNADGSMPPQCVRKYMQINHMVALLEPPLLDLLPHHSTVRILDAGCGSSYLTLALAWCFKHRWRHSVQVLGVDRNPEVIHASTKRAHMVMLDDVLRFREASIHALNLVDAWAQVFASSVPDQPIHVLVSLHACDTATDDALALGVKAGANVIASAPCCHAELARKWADLDARNVEGALRPVWASPHLRREAGATMTDALRTLLLRSRGYVVTPLEFVPSTHTPKNTLLRAVKRGGENPQATQEYQALKQVLGGVAPRLEELLPFSRTLEAAEPRSGAGNGVLG